MKRSMLFPGKILIVYMKNMYCIPSALLLFLNLQPGSEIIDIGTGGGFPGIPLAIFFPEVKFHLVDSIGKKLKVVEAVAEGIGLKNVTTQHSRAEDIKNKKFDFVVSRAVAPLKDLWRWSKPLLKKRLKNKNKNQISTKRKTQIQTTPPGSDLPERRRPG